MVHNIITYYNNYYPHRKSSHWAKEFSEQQSTQTVAKQMTQTISDPQIQATEFMEYVRNMASGQTGMEPGQTGMASGQDSDDWVKEFEQSKGGFWSQLESEWNDLSK